MNIFKHIVRILCGIIFFIWFLTFVIPKIPAVQNFLGKEVSMALEEKIGSKVQIGRVDLRLPNRITIDDVLLYDQQQKEMIKAGRISAGIEILPLIEGKIRITSAQLFGMQATLYQKDAQSPLNCQFLIDSLKSKDTLSQTPLDLAISSLIIRHGAVRYDRNDVAPSHGKFSTAHLNISNISSHIILNKLTDDDIDMNIRRLSFKEQSGLDVQKLSLRFTSEAGTMTVKDLILQLPDTRMLANATLSMDVNSKASGGSKTIKNYKADISFPQFTPADLSFLEEKMAKFDAPFAIELHSKGDNNTSYSKLRLSNKTYDTQLNAHAVIHGIFGEPTGNIKIEKLHTTMDFLTKLKDCDIDIPQQLLALGNINATADASILSSKHIRVYADIHTSMAGDVKANAEYFAPSIKGNIQTNGLSLAQILNEKQLGDIVCDIDVNIQDINNISKNASVKGSVSKFFYNDYTYNNINLDVSLRGNKVSGIVDINDPNIRMHAKGIGDIALKTITQADIDMQNFSAHNLHLTNVLGEECHSMHLTVSPTNVSLSSDIADINLDGTVNLTSLPSTVNNIIASRLPSMPGIKRTAPTHDNFTISTRIKDVTLIKQLLPAFDIKEEVTLNGYLDATSNSADLTLFMPSANIYGMKMEETTLHFYTPDNTLHTDLSTIFMEENGPVSIDVNAVGHDNKLLTTLNWNNNRENIFKGRLTTDATFFNTPTKNTSVLCTIPKSHFQVGDSLWTIEAKGIRYEKDYIAVDNFNVGNDTQNVHVHGNISRNINDVLTADLCNVNIAYILNLVNFHSVEFDGSASGHFEARTLLDVPEAHGFLDIHNFLFEKGRMGETHIDVKYSNETSHIDILGVADDKDINGKTIFEGYISPTPGAIELNIHADHARMEFLDSFCGTFMHDGDMYGSGDLVLYGPFSDINLKGQITANGSFTLTSTNCRYTLPGDTITFVPDDIQFKKIPLLDAYGNKALLSGGIHHISLTQLSYDITADAQQFLAYDVPTLPEDEIFCGKALVNGKIGIHGKGNELLITANAKTLPGTFLIYNATSPDAIRSGDIVTWRSANDMSASSDGEKNDGEGSILSYGNISNRIISYEDISNSILDAGNNRTNIRMNFIVDATPEAKLHVIMDENTGDYIDLFGNGNLRVNYYNKGSLDIFGNYGIENGVYKMTIQNLLRRDFAFLKGGTITFGGDPYNAVLNMQAAYPIASVPLADLNIGSNFTSGNVPVNCLMNITGSPGKPSVAFDLELPSLSSDARQMIQSIINSEEEMNQQVLYLLAIGRFYAPSSTTATHNEDTERVSQSSLAVQSFLSGTLSQQFTNALNSVMGNILGAGNTLSFGANIAPGDEGFNNAEYEGILSGSLFNNRLNFNGQFGYRDNIKTNSTNFIGDFAVQYLLTRNGNIALKMYNQSNDRYFTRNALNTQGIGIVFQREWGK